MNFAEQLVQWYLRLNGFFPITNFVLHHGAGNRTSDADLLAVRFPHVSEDIGGQAADWDERFRNDWHIDLRDEIVGLIVEVKSGAWSARDLDDTARKPLVPSGLRRLGMIPQDQIEMAVDQLRRRAITRVGGFTTAKLFVGNGRLPEGKPWLHVELDDVDRFILQRMATYRDRKRKDRLFFQGDLIQYLAWKGG